MAINTFSGGNPINSLQAAGKNAAINGSYDVWQRGTSVSVAANVLVYTADRWQVYNGVNQAMTVSRQATGDTTNLPFIQYCARVQRNSGQTGTTETFFSQPLESVNSIPLAGKTVTVSFYARKGADYSPTSSNLKINLVSGTGTDQNITTYTGGASVASVTNALTTTWTRYTVTGTVGATATELRIDFAWTPTGTASTNDYFEVTGVQLELGTTATTFSRAGGSIQGELAACQRYYWRVTTVAEQKIIGPSAYAATSTVAVANFVNPVPMRINASSVDFSNIIFANYTGTQYAMTAVTQDPASITTSPVYATITGATAGHVGRILSSSSLTSYIGFSAEL